MNTSVKIAVLSVIVSSFFVLTLAAQHNIPEDFCISTQELKLYNLVNKCRKENNQSEVSLSKNLCYVAKLHVSDLFYNHPDTGMCNLHSWSDKGIWAECCYGRNIFNNTCMTAKPKELTAYPGNGYEIAFWESVDAIPEVVLDLWKTSSASNDLILNRGIWEDENWTAFGVGMLKGYAVVWFGSEADSDEGVKICSTGEMAGRLIDKVQLEDKPQINSETRYYLIIASFKEEAQAKSEVARLKKRGFRSPSVVLSGENFRVSLGNYATPEEATAAKKSLNEKYKAAWLLKY